MAVYTEVPDDALRGFLADYNIGRLVACKGIAEGVENSNFLVRTTAGDFILTLYEKRVDVVELPYFLGLMEHLSDRGVVCPRPVPGRDGKSLRRLCGRAAAVTTFLPGVWPRHIQVQHCIEVGTALAVLHRAGQGFSQRRLNALGPAGWPSLLARSRAHPAAATLRRGVIAELERALEAVLASWPAAPLPQGHIHADLFPDNVFFLEGRLSGLIDFYFAATDLLAYDIAICINAWCFHDDGQLDRVRAAALLQAYDRVRSVTAGERSALPVLCAGAALRFALTRLYDWLATPTGALVTRKDPMDYVERLRVFRAGGAAVLDGV